MRTPAGAICNQANQDEAVALFIILQALADSHKPDLLQRDVAAALHRSILERQPEQSRPLVRISQEVVQPPLAVNCAAVIGP